MNATDPSRSRHDRTVSEHASSAEVDLESGSRAKWDELRRQPTFWAGVGILGFFVAVGVYAVLVSGSGLTHLELNPAYQSYPVPGPSAGHPFGIMSVTGIDLFQGLLKATPIDLILMIFVIVPALAVGLFLGSYAGLHGGGTDAFLTYFGDILVGVPPFFLVLVIFLGAHLLVKPPEYPIIFVLGFILVLWPYYARPVRARAQEIAREPFVEASKASGATPYRLLRHHVLPNAFYPVLAQVPVDVYNVFFFLTAFPFLGCFAPRTFIYVTPFPTTAFPEWGLLLSQGACYGFSFVNPLLTWWMYVIPAVVIVVFGLAVMLLCDGAEKLLQVRRAG